MTNYDTQPQNTVDNGGADSFQVGDELLIRGETTQEWLQGADPVEVEQ